MSMQVREGQQLNWDNVDVTKMDTYPTQMLAEVGSGYVATRQVCRQVVPCGSMPNLSNPNRDELSAENRWAHRNE